MEWVATPLQLQRVIEELSDEPALGVDVEHHARHSYHGFICCIQLSTGELQNKDLSQPLPALNKNLSAASGDGHEGSAPWKEVPDVQQPSCSAWWSTLRWLPLRGTRLMAQAACAGRRDVVVDALALHDHLGLLQEIFGDPRILKVGLRVWHHRSPSCAVRD